jgi:hypothetical protein
MDVLAGGAADAEEVNWDLPERFFLMLNSIPLVGQRLSAWSFMLTCEKDIQDMRCGPPRTHACRRRRPRSPLVLGIGSNTLRQIATAMDELRTCKHLPLIMQVIITLGNHMNGGTPKGQVCSAQAACPRTPVTRAACRRTGSTSTCCHGSWPPRTAPTRSRSCSTWPVLCRRAIPRRPSSSAACPRSSRCVGAAHGGERAY